MRLLLLVLASFLTAAPAAEARVFPAEYRFSLDAGYMHLGYSETHPYQPSQSISGFAQDGMHVSGELLYYLVTRLNGDRARYEGVLAFLGDFSFLGLPFSSSINGTTVNMLRLNGRLGVVIPFLPEPFTLNLMGGMYSTWMWTTNNAFGYQRLTGPQLYPVLHWAQYSENHVPVIVSAFFKYSPVTDGTSSFSWSNREIAAGFAVRIPKEDSFEWLKQGYEKSFTIKASYTDLQHTFQFIRSIAVHSETFQVSVGYDW